MAQQTINSISITQPSSPQNITGGDSFTMGGQLSASGHGGWPENVDMYFEWDQGTGTWQTIPSSGDLHTADTNPAVVADANEHTITVNSDNFADGTFNIRTHGHGQTSGTDWYSSTVQINITAQSTPTYTPKIIVATF